ncbi:MAG TPA: hypothetical protein VHW24_15055 [Bryobacteraceae bacterium]|jgi:hypothetical protein|nr:hypothetical protein [Bryobacteraceae bacterium]
MSERRETNDAGTIWRNQPEEEVTVQLEQFIHRRTMEIHSSTRSEILMSIGAAVFFFVVIMLRTPAPGDPLLDIGLVALVVWAAAVLYVFRRQFWPRASSRPDATATTGLEYYRKELERRRDHLRIEWLWHGPLFLASLILIAVIFGRSFVGWASLRSAAPLIALLAAWFVFGVVRRLRQARELQRQIDEMGR